MGKLFRNNRTDLNYLSTFTQSVTLLFIFWLSSCNLFDKKPKLAEDALRQKIESESEGYIKLVDFKKLDGKKIEALGYKDYEMDFGGFFQYQKDCYKSGGMFSSWLYGSFHVLPQKPTGWDAYTAGNVKECAKGLKVGYMGKATFEEKESGWVLTGFKIAETKDAGVEPLEGSQSENKHDKFPNYFSQFKKNISSVFQSNAKAVKTEESDANSDTGGEGSDLPFTGKKYYAINQMMTGSGTPQYFVEIREGGDVYFGYDQKNMNEPNDHQKINAGSFQHIMECKNSDCADGRFFIITATSISMVDASGRDIADSECCTGVNENDEPCPCKSDFW